MLVTVLDVTNDVRSRMLAAESAERLRVILDEMPVGANVRDAKTGELIINNRASRDILGLELRQHSDSGSLASFGARFPDGRVLGPDDHAFRRAMLTRKPVRNQIVMLKRAGTNEEIRRSLERGDRRQPRGGRVGETTVGILAHDLRTPLNAITMGGSLLATRLADTPDAKIVSRIVSSAHRMGEMVTQLLDLTRSRLAGGIPVELQPVDLVAILSGVLDAITIANPDVTFSTVLESRRCKGARRSSGRGAVHRSRFYARFVRSDGGRGRGCAGASVGSPSCSRSARATAGSSTAPRTRRRP